MLGLKVCSPPCFVLVAFVRSPQGLLVDRETLARAIEQKLVPVFCLERVKRSSRATGRVFIGCSLF